MKKLVLALMMIASYGPADFVVASPFQASLFESTVITMDPSLTHVATIPERSAFAPEGSEFIATIAHMSAPEREAAIADQIENGNIPSYLKNLKPVSLTYHPRGKGQAITATIFVTPDYLAVGSDDDSVLIPMNFITARQVVSQLGFVLPTRKMVDAIYQQANEHLRPHPLPAGPKMTSSDYYRKHNDFVTKQRANLPKDELISGHKKDVILTNRLDQNPGTIAIYGWHRTNGRPIQPVSTVHSATYADYSHGIRLVSETVLIDGQVRSIYDVLEDPRLAWVLSDEGVMKNVEKQMGVDHDQTVVASIGS